MTTTTKNHNCYHEVLMAPRCFMRRQLENDYNHIMSFGLNTVDIIAVIADHLTAYNEISDFNFFVGMNFFKSNN